MLYQKKNLTSLIFNFQLIFAASLFIGCAESNYNGVSSRTSNWKANFKNGQEPQNHLQNLPSGEDETDSDGESNDQDDDAGTDSNGLSNYGSGADSESSTDKQANDEVSQDDYGKQEMEKIEEIFRSPQTNLRADEYFRDYNEVLKSKIISITLKEIISNNGKSKRYQDLLALDGGTVGIAHFASGGLADLYRQMNTKHYFGYDQNTMIAQYSSRCQSLEVKGRKKGCYGLSFWYNGMKKFLNSSESEKIQNAAFFARNQRLVESVLVKGWHYSYEIMIAISVANSLGFGGFHKLASKYHWNANHVLKHYAKLSQHKKRRALLITSYLTQIQNTQTASIANK